MLFFNRKLFREEAVANKWQSEPLDGLLQVTAPHEWLIVGSFALAMLGVLAWGVFGRVERSVLADCVTARAGARHAVLADAAGTVTEVLVVVGDQVAAGGPITRMQRPALNWRVRVARAQVALLSGAEGEQERAALAAAQAELLELESIAAAGALLVSPWAGEITALDLTPGQAVMAGAEVARVRTSAPRRWETLAFVEPAAARRLQAGMEGQVSVAAPEGDSAALAAEVSSISRRSAAAPDWLARLGLSVAPGATGHLVRLTLPDEAGGAPLADGAPCRLRIVTRRHSPVQLLAPPW